MTPTLELWIAGIPAPKGSKTAFKRGGNVVLVEASKALPAWRKTCFTALQKASEGWRLLDRETPVRVELTFHLPKPRTVTRWLPTVKPDLDKLARAILDSVTEAGGIWIDDAQVVDLTVRKRYGNAGCSIRIHEMKD